MTDTGAMMQANTEIVAVVLPDGTPIPPDAIDDFVATGTMLLVRHEDGRLSLEPANRRAAYTAPKQATYRSKPIVDPNSREVLGYEMEMMAHNA